MADTSTPATIASDELDNALREAELQLEDIREERLFTLGQTGVHLGAEKVAKMRATWEREEQALAERIARLRERLDAKIESA